MGNILDRFKPRIKGTKERPLSNYEKQLVTIAKEKKQTTKDASFSVTAGKFGKNSNTLSGIAKEIGVTLKSLEKENPKIKDLNKIKASQPINVPVRKRTFMEKYVTGSKNSPKIVKDTRVTKDKEKVVYKKGSQGKVYKGMSTADMKKIQMKKKKS